MKFILGKKIEMTQIWKDEEVIAVTKVQAGPCFVTQVKNEEKDGYKAVQVGFDKKKEKNIKKPQIGHLKKSKSGLRYLKEFRFKNEDLPQLELGDVIKVDTFAEGDKVKVSGVSKGRGFQGVVKRHGFHGSRKTHGNKDQLRMPGSIGATGPAHVFKGTRMGGRMGGDKITIANLELVKIDLENNILYIKGAVPGARNSLLMIYGDGEVKVSKPEKDLKQEVKEEKENNAEKDAKNTKEDKEEIKEENKKEVKEVAKNTEKQSDQEKSKKEDNDKENREDKENKEKKE